MNLAKLSCNGQITVPAEIRRKLNVKTGDKIVFLQKEDGEIIIQNLNIAEIMNGKVKTSAAQQSS